MARRCSPPEMLDLFWDWKRCQRGEDWFTKKPGLVTKSGKRHWFQYRQKRLSTKMAGFMRARFGADR